MATPLYGRPFVFAIPGLWADDDTYFPAPSLTANDIKVYKDGDFVASGLTTLPVNDPVGSPGLRLQLSAEETTCQSFRVDFSSPTGDWRDLSLTFYPQSSSNAGYVDLVFGDPATGTKLTIRKSGGVSDPQKPGVWLRFEVLEAEGVEKEIFVYILQIRNTITHHYVGQFSHICGPTDFPDVPKMADLPSPPRVTDTYYRHHTLDLLFTNVDTAVDAEQKLWQDIATLQHNLERIKRITQTKDVVIGGILGPDDTEVDPPTPEPPVGPTYGDEESAEDTATTFSNTAFNAGYKPWSDDQEVSLNTGDISNVLAIDGFDVAALAIPADAAMTKLELQVDLEESAAITDGYTATFSILHYDKVHAWYQAATITEDEDNAAIKHVTMVSTDIAKMPGRDFNSRGWSIWFQLTAVKDNVEVTIQSAKLKAFWKPVVED